MSTQQVQAPPARRSATDHTDPDHNADYVPGHDAVADGASFAPGQAFAQSWRMRNSGNKAWALGYRLVCVGGAQWGAPVEIPIPACPPQAAIAVAVGFVAPAESGSHQSIWQLSTPNGHNFGDRVWTMITVGTATNGAGPSANVAAPPNSAFAPAQLVAAPAAAGPAQTVAKTWNQYGGLILQEADRVGIHPGLAVAVLAAESKGEPFDANGRLIIRFENHIFYTYWGKENEERFRQHFTFATDESWKGHQWRADVNSAWQPVHPGDQESEWRVFTFARTLDEKAAMYSISMGAPQIMGFNHRSIGYDTVQAMFNAFSSDARAQITSLFRFMEVNKLVNAVRDSDFHTFAKVYNGAGQADTYQQIIKKHLDAYQTLAFGDSAPRGTSATAAPRLPQLAPERMADGRLLSDAEPKLYAAWRQHIEQGFQNNQTMFSRILSGFMNPYWITVTMYTLLFAVGLIAFVVAIILGLRATSNSAAAANATATILGTTAIFGGISVVAFLTYFLNRPLQALEENLQFITWLGIIYNTYWTRLAYIQKQETVQAELESATNDAITKITALMNKHTELSGKRPTISAPESKVQSPESRVA